MDINSVSNASSFLKATSASSAKQESNTTDDAKEATRGQAQASVGAVRPKNGGELPPTPSAQTEQEHDGDRDDAQLQAGQNVSAGKNNGAEKNTGKKIDVTA
jgi:N-acetylmuramoyl-L-alanine amidase CwlA